MSVLHALGLLDNLQGVIDISRDAAGQMLASKDLPERARSKRKQAPK
jgi:hypothetical protein